MNKVILQKVNQVNSIVRFCRITKFDVINIKNELLHAFIYYDWKTLYYNVIISSKNGESRSRLRFKNFKEAYYHLQDYLSPYLEK